MNNWRMGVIVFALVAMIGMARADEPATINVTGHSTVQMKPQILRMKMTITATGNDIRDAISKLKQQRDDIRSKLIAAGASKDAIRFSDPGEGTQQNLTPQQRMMAQIQMSMNRRNMPPAATQPASVTVCTELSAEWPLTDEPGDDALISSHELIEKIKSVIPKPGASAKTPEEQEVAEETYAAQASNGQPNLDQPVFIFVHKVSDEERTSLLRAALDDAKAQAARIAEARGVHLGVMVRISNSRNDTENLGNAYVEAMMEQSGMSSGASSDQNEATGDQRNNVSCSVTLATTFAME